MAWGGPNFDIRLLGDEELTRNLKRLDHEIQKKIAKRALREGAKPMLETAKSLVPVRTGRLRDSLKIKSYTASRGGYITADVKPGKREELGISKDDKHYYPSVLEFGDKRRGIQPKPYLRPAFDANKSRSLSIVKAIFKAGIESFKFNTRVKVNLPK